MNTSSISIRSPSFGTFPSTASGCEQLRVGDDLARPFTRSVSPTPGIKNSSPTWGFCEDVAERVGEPVARPLGNQQRALVEDADEAGRVAARADVAGSVGRRGREADERREVDERRVRSLTRSLTLADELVGLTEQLAERPRPIALAQRLDLVSRDRHCAGRLTAP